MNYIKRKDREQLRIESIESYVDKDSEIRVIADFTPKVGRAEKIT